MIALVFPVFLALLAGLSAALLSLYPIRPARRRRADRVHARVVAMPALSPAQQRLADARTSAELDVPWIDFEGAAVLSPADTRAWLAEQDRAETARVNNLGGMTAAQALRATAEQRLWPQDLSIFEEVITADDQPIKIIPSVLPERPSFLGCNDPAGVSDLSPSVGRADHDRLARFYRQRCPLQAVPHPPVCARRVGHLGHWSGEMIDEWCCGGVSDLSPTAGPMITTPPSVDRVINPEDCVRSAEYGLDSDPHARARAEAFEYLPLDPAGSAEIDPAVEIETDPARARGFDHAREHEREQLRRARAADILTRAGRGEINYAQAAFALNGIRAQLGLGPIDQWGAG